MTKEKESLNGAFVVLGTLFCVCLVTSNLLETKIFHVFGDVNLTCGFLVFPISYIINDCITEVWGFRKARFVIWLGFMMNFFVVALGAVACWLPPLEEGADDGFKSVFGFAPMIAVASLTAFLVGSFLNAWVMSRMKKADKSTASFDLRFSFRAVISTVVGEGVDSLIFFPMAFYLLPMIFDGAPKVSFGVLMSIMLTQVVAKTLYEIMALPLTVRLVKFVEKY